MVEFRGLVKINFFKKENFTGSCGGMCFKVESKDKNAALLATIWPGPYSSDNTPDDKKQYANLSNPNRFPEGTLRLILFLQPRLHFFYPFRTEWKFRILFFIIRRIV